MPAGPRTATDFPVSLYATPNPLFQEVFYTVLRAGHLRAASRYTISRTHFPGHELILCLSGRSMVRVAGAEHAVARGDLVWFNCHHPHEHRADPDDPWEALWVRIEGPRLERMCSMLSVHGAPVIRGVEVAPANSSFREVFRHMQRDTPESAPSIHAAVARLLALACCARQLPSAEVRVPESLQRAIDSMKRRYFEPHTVAGLALLAGMSASHFARVFRRAFGTGPIDWLRRERINQAKRRLSESSDPVQWIAEQVGYRDRFFFSKDFKKMTGVSPREFRARETGGG